MKSIAVVFFCLASLACLIHGRRSQPSGSEWQSGGDSSSDALGSESLAGADQSTRELGGRGRFSLIKLMFTLLMATRPASAFTVAPSSNLRVFNGGATIAAAADLQQRVSSSVSSANRQATSVRMDEHQEASIPDLPWLPVSDAGRELLSSFVEAVAAPERLNALLKESFQQLGQAELRMIALRAQKDDNYKTITVALDRLRDQRMTQAKESLEELLTAGEINDLDVKMVSLVKDGISPEFVIVLNQNIAAAAGEADERKRNILIHVSTRIQEELEKTVKPEKGVLHKLMRTDDAGLRLRILEHYLLPQMDIVTPDGRVIPLSPPRKAQIDPMQFSEAIEELVGELRGVDADGEAVSRLIEEVRQCAKQARAVVVKGYSQEVVDEFSNALTPCFQGDAPAKA